MPHTWTRDVNRPKLVRVPLRPRILDISFSPIARDARVLRQLQVGSKFGDLTTVGYGPASPWSANHIEVPGHLSSLPRSPIGIASLLTRDFSAAQSLTPASLYALKSLATMPLSYDLVIANDARALPIAFAMAGGAPVWADMHEWAAEENNGDLRWRVAVSPFMDWLCAHYLPLAAAVTTVSPQIAKLYQQRYGVSTLIMRNAGPFQELSPMPVNPGGPIRLVHSGIAKKGRNVSRIIRAVQQVGPGFTLDLYLLPAGDGGKHLRHLHAQALGDNRIRFKAPVPPEQLPATLNRYDVGIFVLPPSTASYRWALPNKFFDFVQARLGIVTGPTAPMADLVNKYDLGLVTNDFTTESVVSTLHKLTPDRVERMKAASDSHAQELSFSSEAKIAESILRRLLDNQGRRH